MLKLEDIVIEIGRAGKPGLIGDFMRVVHIPTGISFSKGPPLGKQAQARKELIEKLKAELRERGLVE